jgi:hypothetical protein
VDQVLGAYDHRAKRGAELAGGEIERRLDEIIGDLAAARGEHLGHLTLAGLLNRCEASGAAGASCLPGGAPTSTIPPSRTVGQ